MIYALGFYSLDWMLSNIIANPYFILHSLLNTIIGTFVLIQDDKPNLLFQIIIEFHLYHIIVYWKILSIKDIIHHICTIIVLGVCFLDESGGGEFEMKFALFSMCGLPDAIDFGALALYNNKIISKTLCLTTCYIMNVYIRMPLCILSSIATSTYAIQSNINHHLYFGMICAFATLCNGIFFATDILIKYYRNMFLK